MTHFFRYAQIHKQYGAPSHYPCNLCANIFLSVQLAQLKNKLNKVVPRYTQFIILMCLFTYFSVNRNNCGQYYIRQLKIVICVCRIFNIIKKNLPFLCLLIVHHCTGHQILSSQNIFVRGGLDTVSIVVKIKKLIFCRVLKPKLNDCQSENQSTKKHEY